VYEKSLLKKFITNKMKKGGINPTNVKEKAYIDYK